MLGDIGAGIGSLGGGIAVLAGAGGSGGEDQYKKAIEVFQKLQLPGQDIRQIPAPDLKIFSEFFPEVYQAIVPEEVKLAVDSPDVRAAQMRSLATFEDMRDNGLPLSERLAAEQAGKQLSGEIAGANRAVQRGLAERGRLGGGDAAVLQMMGNQSAAEMANAMGNNLLQQAQANRMAGAQGAANLGGAIRGQDIGLSGLNAEYANRFNELTTGRQNEAAKYAAAMGNQANAYNTQTKQRVGEQNVMNRYQNDIRNQEYPNLMRQTQYDNAFKKAQALAGAYQGYGSEKDRIKAANDAAIMGMGKGAGQAVGGIGDLGLAFL